MKKKDIITSVILFLIIFCFLVIECVGTTSKMDKENRELKKLSFVVTKQEKSKGIIKLTGHFKSKIPKDKKVFFRIQDVKLSMWKNNTKVYPLKEDSQNRGWGQISNTAIEPTDQMVIELEKKNASLSSEDVDTLLEHFFQGNKSALIYQQLMKNIVKIILSMSTILISLIMIIVLFAVRIQKLSNMKGYLSCAGLMLSGGICTLIDYEYITIIMEHTRVIVFVDYLSQVLICFFLMSYLALFVTSKKWSKVIQSMIFAFQLMIVLYCFLYHFNMWENQLVIGLFILVIIGIIVTEIVILIKGDLQSKNQDTSYILWSSIGLSGFIIVEMIHYYVTGIFWIYVFQIGLCIFTLIQMIVMLRDAIQNEIKYEKQQRELTNSRVAIMLSQIQPHFLYNALLVIQNLCHDKAPKAEEVVIEFSKFLRGNMVSLTQDSPISFDKELDHVKNYLSLEKHRFEERLNVQYEIQERNFRVPALSLQPIVENAVRYGIMCREEGGTIWISSRKVADGYEIKVTDDGVGYDIMEPKQDGRTHIGISNVKNRIETMCNGHMEIESKSDIGTTVVIFVPEEGE